MIRKWNSPRASSQLTAPNEDHREHVQKAMAGSERPMHCSHPKTWASRFGGEDHVGDSTAHPAGDETPAGLRFVLPPWRTKKFREGGAPDKPTPQDNPLFWMAAKHL